MGAAQRSAPPPGLKEICQDPIRLLSSAYNVWMTVPHKSNKAPRFHSAVKANVGGAFVVTQTIIWQFRHSRSNLCMALRLNWPFLKDEDDLNKSCSQTMSHTHQCQFLSLATNNEDFFSQFERVSGDAFRLFFFWLFLLELLKPQSWVSSATCACMLSAVIFTRSCFQPLLI